MWVLLRPSQRNIFVTVIIGDVESLLYIRRMVRGYELTKITNVVKRD